MAITDLFTDGGVCGRNPSTEGGTWAWCHVQNGQRVRHESGFIARSEVGLDKVTNNLTELFAAVRGMESLPPGWSGTIWTDSQITLLRIRRGKQAKLNGIPDWLRERLAAVKARLGNSYRVGLLGGHPSRKDLARGTRTDGTPVSVHNVFCDGLCRKVAEEFTRFCRQLAELGWDKKSPRERSTGGSP